MAEDFPDPIPATGETGRAEPDRRPVDDSARHLSSNSTNQTPTAVDPRAPRQDKGQDKGQDKAAAARSGAPRQRYLRQYELVERIKAYDPSVDEALINRAYVFAVKAHGAQTRYSGDPYFAHPIQVAGILTELRLDAASIAAGLLHDVLEDTEATASELGMQFGDSVRVIVEGVTKLSKLEVLSEKEKQAENLRRFILATAQDVRVLLVKLADRLHNMRTLSHHPKEASRQRIARETLDIYAPLARMIGVYAIAGELEDLAFATLNPVARDTIISRVEAMRAKQSGNVSRVSGEIVDRLFEMGIDCEVSGREKLPYSIWRKLERKGISFEDLGDIYAFRVIVPDVDACYRALGVIHRHWRCVPDRFHDYISVPKQNGYRSLHTTIVGPGNARVELQVRTTDMDRVAEYGLAAHWRYKNQSYAFDQGAADHAGHSPESGLQNLLAILADGGDAEDFLENAKLQLYQGQVFAFTPKGRLIVLPKGATALDFAYHVHTDLGDHCARARVNGAERPLRTPLVNGDVVEIVDSVEAVIHTDWQALAVTGRARSAIKRLIRTRRQEEFERIGSDLAVHAFHQFGRPLGDLSLRDALSRLDFADDAALFQAIGEGRVLAIDVVEAVFPGITQDLRSDTARTRIEGRKTSLFVYGGGLTPGISLFLAPCCTPIPGDRIVGVRDPGTGIHVHTIDCETLAKAEERDWLDLHWKAEAERDTVAIARILVCAENSPGVLARLCTFAAEARGNIVNVRVIRRAMDAFDILFDIEVAGLRELLSITAAMRADRTVLSVERLRGRFDGLADDIGNENAMPPSQAPLANKGPASSPDRRRHDRAVEQPQSVDETN